MVADIDMSDYFARSGLEQYSEITEDFEIRPDIVGIIDKKKIVFIESKIVTLGIKEIGQLLGYCLVANPELAILCSTKNSSGNLTTILTHENLTKYDNDKRIKFGYWDHTSNSMLFLN